MTQLALVFHANQSQGPFAMVASRASYRGLWRVLRAHPHVRCSLHISGTLIHSLLWYDPEALELVRAGVADGQFELLGSTYAQNVPYATHDLDNAWQIEAHRTLLASTFGVTPIGFWNSERCWRQSLAPVILQGGYRYTLIEHQALLRAGAPSAYHPYWTGTDEHRLDVLPDHENFKQIWNWSVWSNRGPAAVLDYLRAPEVQGGLVVYAEDAEAFGLWGYERGQLPQADWAHLDALLSALEAEPDITFVTLGSVAPPEVHLPVISDHQATWMVGALRHINAPYHEDGYRDWFDYVARAEKLVYFRDLFETVRNNLVRAGHVPDGGPDSPQARLLALAHLVYAGHQYEFGCIGIGHRGFRRWEQVRTAAVLARAVLLAAQVDSNQLAAWRADVNHDHVEELLLCDGRQLAVLTAVGGRLLYWIDLTRGEVLIGNPLANWGGGWHSDATFPESASVPVPWLPDDAPLDLAAWEAARQRVPAPGVWGPLMAEAIWRNGPAELDSYTRPPASSERMALAVVQQRGLNDSVLDGRRRIFGPERSEVWDAALEHDRVTFTQGIAGKLTVRKQITLNETGIEVIYTWENVGATPLILVWESEQELCPAYPEILAHGRAALRFWTQSSARRQARWRPTTRANHQTRGVLNVVAGLGVACEAEPEPQRARGVEGGFALGIVLIWDLRLAPGESQVVRVALAPFTYTPPATPQPPPKRT